MVFSTERVRASRTLFGSMRASPVFICAPSTVSCMCWWLVFFLSIKIKVGCVLCCAVLCQAGRLLMHLWIGSPVYSTYFAHHVFSSPKKKKRSSKNSIQLQSVNHLTNNQRPPHPTPFPSHVVVFGLPSRRITGLDTTWGWVAGRGLW